MEKTADLAMIQKTNIDTLHKEGKAHKVITERCGCLQSAVSKHITFTFTFNHLADAFIQSDVQMRRTIEAIRPSREQQYTSAMTSLS